MGWAACNVVIPFPRLLFRPPSSPLLSILLHLNNPLPFPAVHSSLLRRPSRLLLSLRTLHALPSPSPLHSQLQFHETTEEEEDDELPELDGGGESEGVRVEKINLPVPELSVKEKKELASYAHSLGDKLKSQQVGKSGVSPNTVMAFSETLESNELLKVKIHRTCPGELDDVVKELELRTGSVSVGQIGRIVIFYRPSISKLKAVEKKKQARKVFMDRKLRSTPTIQGNRERGPREYERSRRGGSRFSSSTTSEQ